MQINLFQLLLFMTKLPNQYAILQSEDCYQNHHTESLSVPLMCTLKAWSNNLFHSQRLYLLTHICCFSFISLPYFILHLKNVRHVANAVHSAQSKSKID